MAIAIDIDLGTEQSAFVDELVASGRYQSASDVIEAALRLYMTTQEQQTAALRIEIQKGLDSGISERTFDEIIASAKDHPCTK